MIFWGGTDFETTQPYPTAEGDATHAFLCCAWGFEMQKKKGKLVEVGEPLKFIFHNIKDYVDWVLSIQGKLVAYNLKFETSFILDYLIKNNITNYDFLESEMNIYTFNLGRVQFTDAANFFIGQPLDNVAQRMLGYGKINHNVIFEKDHIATEKDIEYCLRDCEVTYLINKKHLQKMKELASQLITDTKVVNQIDKKLTNSSIAYYVLLHTIGEDYYHSLFPSIPYKDKQYMRQAYFGGMVGVKEGTYKNIHSHDIVQCYPSCLVENEYPCGTPIYTTNPLDISTNQFWIATFEIINLRKKPRTMPTILEKSYFGINNFITKTPYIKRTLSSVDYALLLNNYYFDECNFLDGYFFTEKIHGNDVFGKYINHFSQYALTLKNKIKECKKHNDFETANLLEQERDVAKVYNNGIGGKFSTRAMTDDYKYVINEHNIIERTTVSQTYKPELDVYYLPTAIFMTSYARVKLSTVAEILDFATVVNFDTDSIKSSNELPEKFRGNTIGKWDYDFFATEMKCVAPKCYAYKYVDKDGKECFNIKCKGISKKAIENEKQKQGIKLYNDFGASMEIDILQSKRIIGGIALYQTHKKVKRG
jgi:hypothetical protein